MRTATRPERSLWLAAVWTGVGAAAVCATIAIVSVAVCWLPAAGASGHTVSAVRAGLLTFLASLHGGVVVDGSTAQFLPLGLTLLAGAVCWRAGGNLAETAADVGERDARRLTLAALAQAGSFTTAALVLVPFAGLGTSGAQALGVAVAAPILFLASGGVAFVRSGPLRDSMRSAVPPALHLGTRAAAAALAVYLGAGALLVAVSLVLHAGRVQEISRQLGGGWAGVPVLVLGVLAAPNAVIAGATYLLGPGFTVGAGTTVGLHSASHGVVPAFPLLAALPQHRAGSVLWAIAAVVALTAGAAAAKVVCRGAGWRARWIGAAAAAAVFGVALFLLAWQGGGGIGAGRLRVVGASPWQSAGYGFVALALTGAAALGTRWALSRFDRWEGWANRHDLPAPRLLTPATSEPMRRLRALTRMPAETRDGQDEPATKGPRKLAG